MKLTFSPIYRSILTLLCMVALTAQSQNINDGRQALDAKEYTKAHEIFSKLIRSNPSNAQLGVLYGQSCIKIGDYATAQKYLAPLAKRKILNACFHYAHICMQFYRFEEAVANYEIFLDKAKDQTMIAQAEMGKTQAERAASMLRSTEEIEVIDSIVVDKTSFLQHYKLSNEGGFLHRYNSFFDSPKGIESSVFETLKKDKIIYSLPVKERGYDLYTQVKLLDKYGDAKALPEVINTEYNENFPFICSDGMTLYYASDNPEKGIGNYDILITRYSTSNDAYLAPENVGMPFNSTANDYMMAIDDGHGVGWFASDRNQSQDRVCIYIFIPNAEKKILESDDPELRIAQAQLLSIKATQKKRDYKALLASIFNNQPQKSEAASDFLFPISNQVVYRFEDDFKSPQARNLFEKHNATLKALKEQNRQLDQLRNTYSKATQAKRKELTTKIITLEKTVDELTTTAQKLAVECRNTEIKHIRK